MYGLNAISPSGSYHLSKGDIRVGANYRYFHSWRHFVGTAEQPQRQNTCGSIGTDAIDHGNAVNIYACFDQYFARAGFITSVGKTKDLTFSLAARWEGIPAFYVSGGNAAYHRCDYVVAIESGIFYRSGQLSFSLFVPSNFIKNRIQCATDIARQTKQNEIQNNRPFKNGPRRGRCRLC